MTDLTILNVDVEGGVSIVVELSDDTFAVFTVEQLLALGDFRESDSVAGELPIPL